MGLSPGTFHTDLTTIPTADFKNKAKHNTLNTAGPAEVENSVLQHFTMMSMRRGAGSMEVLDHSLYRWENRGTEGVGVLGIGCQGPGPYPDVHLSWYFGLFSQTP